MKSEVITPTETTSECAAPSLSEQPHGVEHPSGVGAKEAPEAPPTPAPRRRSSGALIAARLARLLQGPPLVDLPADGDAPPFPPDEVDVEENVTMRYRDANFEAAARNRSQKMRLRNVFKTLRRLRHLPSTEKILSKLISGPSDTTKLKQTVETVSDVYSVALVETKGNRQDASVLAGMELCALDGQRVCSQRTIAKLTGLRPTVVSASLCRLRQHKLVEAISNGHWCNEFEMANPLTMRPPPKARCFDDPIDILRLESAELDALPPDDFKSSVIEACLQTAHDNLALKEAKILANISHHEKLRAMDQRILEETRQRILDYQDHLADCMGQLSRIRWARRHPFVPDVEEKQREASETDDLLPEDECQYD